ncbi:MAG: DCC1-like thiol-disulfide oxidoreductase family protein [Bdellovibrionota bacterium]
MELITVLAYVQAGFSKLIVSGLDWASNGTTLQIALIRQGLETGLFFSKFTNLLITLSWASLLLELSKGAVCIDTEGKIFHGATAIARALEELSMPWWPIGRLMQLPILRSFFRRLYNCFSRVRHFVLREPIRAWCPLNFEPFSDQFIFPKEETST